MSEIYYATLKPGITIDIVKQKGINLIQSCVRPNGIIDVKIALTVEQIMTYEYLFKDLEYHSHVIQVQ
jgi:hypothetical protein